MDLKRKRIDFGAHTKKLLQIALQASVGFLLSSGVMFGEYAPLGLGFVAAQGGGIFGYAGIFGAALGYLCLLYRANGLKYLAITALILTERAVFRENGFSHPLVMPIAAAVATALLGFVFLIDGGVHALECIFFFTEVLLVFGCAALYSLARTKHYRAFSPIHKQSFYFCILASLIYPLTRVEIASLLSLGRILSHTCVMLAGYFGGAELGVISAVVLGVTCGSMYCAVYGASALAASLFRKRGSTAFLCAHLTASLLGMLLTQQNGLGVESLAASLLFGAARISFAPALRRVFSFRTPLKTATRDTLRGAAGAFSQLGNMLARISSKPQTEDIASVFSRPARNVCQTCSRAETCWKTEAAETRRALSRVTGAMVKNHALKASDLPLEFSTRCLHLGDFLAEVNRELPAFFCRMEYKHRLKECRNRLCGQYRDVSKVLEHLAEHEESVHPQAYHASLGVAKKRKSGNTVCGDTVGHCRTPSGAVCILLADGMGTGDGAARESRLAVDLLIRFLECGVDPQSALAVVSGALTVKCEETHAFTTLDLLYLNLTDGECALYRFGSAPAYFCTDGHTECVTCTSMPLGLSCEDAPSVECVTRRLRTGEEIILMSDGVSDEVKPAWLMQTLEVRETLTPQALAKEILSRAEGEESDDRTVLVLRICEA